MANEENLLKGKATQFKSGEKAAESGRKGGHASGKAKRQKKLFKEMLAELMQLPVDEKKPRDFSKSKNLNEAVTSGKTCEQMAALALLNKIKKGDTKAIELYLAIIGEKPAELTEVKVTDNRPVESMTYEEAMELLAKQKGGQ